MNTISHLRKASILVLFAEGQDPSELVERFKKQSSKYQVLADYYHNLAVRLEDEE